ncbi:MAG: YfiT family bacillithiol transferase [Bacillota bacterium]
MSDMRYPIGRFSRPERVTEADLQGYMEEIAQLPARLRAAVEDLSEEQLDTPYREGGWTVRQVVHHVADSHLNSYIRFKLALTEEQPTIKPYDEAAWAELPEAKSAPVAVSLTLLEALHDRWVRTLRAMSPGQFGRTFLHPEAGLMRLDQTTALYAWHSRHHVAHITALRTRMGW